MKKIILILFVLVFTFSAVDVHAIKSCSYNVQTESGPGWTSTSSIKGCAVAGGGCLHPSTEVTVGVEKKKMTCG